MAADDSEIHSANPPSSTLGANIHPFPVTKTAASHLPKSAQTGVYQVTFNRPELNALLRVYGFKVASGEWRDYAIDHLADRAVFSIFRRTSEMPLYRVEKDPSLARKQGQYKVIAASGHIMKRGHELSQVLKVLEKPLKVVSG